METISTELNPQVIELMNTLAAALQPKSEKKKSKKGKFVMIVNGKVQSQIIPTMKEAKQAARVIILSALAKGVSEPSISIAEITKTLTIDVPVGTEDSDGIKG